jgi:hypothetical protein
MHPAATERAREYHPGHQDQHVDGNPGGHQGRGEPAERLRGHDRAAAAADRLDHHVGVLGQPGRVVVAGQVRRKGVMAALAQLPLDQVPVSSDIPATVNQHEGGHRHPLPAVRCISGNESGLASSSRGCCDGRRR